MAELFYLKQHKLHLISIVALSRIVSWQVVLKFMFRLFCLYFAGSNEIHFPTKISADIVFCPLCMLQGGSVH